LHWSVKMFKVHVSRPTTYRTSSKLSDPYIKTFSILSEVRIMFWIFATVRWSLHKCNEIVLCYKWQCTVHASPLFLHTGVHGSKKTWRHVVQTSIWLISYSGELCNKNYRQEIRDMIIWSKSKARSVKLLSPVSQDAIEWAPDRLLNRAAIGYMVDMLNVGTVYNN